MPRSREKRYSLAAATPQRGTVSVQIPLNDDRQEKAQRLQRRHAEDPRLQSMRASATPARRRVSGMSAADSPHTPQNDMPAVTGSLVTPMRPGAQIPLQQTHLFEEWLRMAKDNRINANNSWNLALIDYFSDMSLLREGDGVDFQKASTTLDGCVKVYTSRVDSVADDTGRLLNGLAESGNRKRRGEDSEGDGQEDDDEGDGDEGEDGDGQKKKRKRAARTAEATLASSMEQLQNKKVDSDFGVDPLFKKASADFDEGGAKGLLLNHLTIDSKGRIIFDSSDDIKDVPKNHRGPTPAADGNSRLEVEADEDEGEAETSEDVEIDVSRLARNYFPDLSRLDYQDVCPSLKDFNLWDAKASLDLPFLDLPDDWRKDDNDKEDEEADNRSGIFLDAENDMGFDDDDGRMVGIDMPEPGFGEGGEAWAREAAIDVQARVHHIGFGGDDDDVRESTEGADEGAGTDDQQYGFSISRGQADEQQNILSYFDNALRKNWAGPSHWRIQKIKNANKSAPTRERKEKVPFEIDFIAPMSQALADAIYQKPTSESTIELPKSQRVSKTRNLLPDDKHFNSKRLVHLFLKPKFRVGQRAGARRQPERHAGDNDKQRDFDVAYWANQENGPEEDGPVPTYDANFFQDDMGQLPLPVDDDDDQFADARDHFSPAMDDFPGHTQNVDGVIASTQEVNSTNWQGRQMYMAYAKTAKKVDARRLKEELWNGLGLEEIKAPPRLQEDPAIRAVDGSLKFTDVVGGLTNVYQGKQLADLSTSYCFICLLHLANEKGLQISNTEDFENLTIRKDFSADFSLGD